MEYAGALGELLRLVAGRDFPEISLEECRIVLVEGMDRLLSQFPKSLGEYARRVLVRRGVDVLVSRILESAEGSVVRLSSGEMISCRTVVWSAGMRPMDPIEGATFDRNPSGRLRVDEHLRVPGVVDVIAIGDAASVPWRNGELPMLSQPAMQEGRHVARLIRDEAVGRWRSRPRKPFRYLDKGAMATIGRSSAAAQIGALDLRGFPGWVAWLAVHIWYLVGFRNRLAVVSSWSWNYPRKDRAIRIVAQSDADPVADAVRAVAPLRVLRTPTRRGSSEEVAEVV